MTPKPAAVPAVWDPCPLQSSGLGSGISVFSPVYASPTRSVPPLTFGAFGPNMEGSAGSELFAKAVSNAATVPGPPKFACV